MDCSSLTSKRSVVKSSGTEHWNGRKANGKSPRCVCRLLVRGKALRAARGSLSCKVRERQTALAWSWGSLRGGKTANSLKHAFNSKWMWLKQMIPIVYKCNLKAPWLLAAIQMMSGSTLCIIHKVSSRIPSTLASGNALNLPKFWWFWCHFLSLKCSFEWHQSWLNLASPATDDKSSYF